MKRKDMEVELRLLRRENRRLKAHVSFLRLMPPSVSPSSNTSPASFSDPTGILFLRPSNSDSDPDIHVPVHRFVLVNSSPIFKEMVDIAEESNVPNRVLKVPDASPQLLESYVNFLYNAETGTTLDDDIARGLLILGDKYQVEFLKTCCEEYLSTKVNVETFKSLFQFACQYNANKLENACLFNAFRPATSYKENDDVSTKKIADNT